MDGYTVGQRLNVAEQHDGQPCPGGALYPGTVTSVVGMYVHVTYDDPALNRGGKPDMFFASTGWRAWDGELRWRLDPYPGQENDD